MSLRQEAAPCWLRTCDTCGAGDNSEYESSFHHTTPADALQFAHEIDWQVDDQGVVTCASCIEEGAEQAELKGRT